MPEILFLKLPGVFHLGKLLYEFQTIHDRHIDVAQNKVHFPLVQYRQSLQAVSGFKDLPDFDARLSEGSLHDFSHDRRIVDDENSYLIHELLDRSFVLCQR